MGDIAVGAEEERPQEPEQLADVLIEQVAAMDKLRTAAEALGAAEAEALALREAYLRAKTEAESVSLRLAGLVQRDTGVIPAPGLIAIQQAVAARGDAWKKGG